MKSSTPVGDLPNIGPVLAGELERVGIRTAGDLDEAGSVEAYRRIGSASADLCWNMLYALEGAVRRMRWHSLTADEKLSLRRRMEGAGESGR